VVQGLGIAQDLGLCAQNANPKRRAREARNWEESTPLLEESAQDLGLRAQNANPKGV
jgi:hypothetical protein